MQSGRYLIALLSCLFLISTAIDVSAQPPSVPLDSVDGLVVGVGEGDRITVNSFGTEINVRLYGIAAPQTAKVDKFTGWYKAGQPYAEDAFRALALKILHQQVKVEIMRTIVFKNSPKQTALAIIYLDGRNINLEMVSEGWAWTYKKLVDRGDIHEYMAAEKVARLKKNGLWLQENPQPPWEFNPKVRIKSKHGG